MIEKYDFPSFGSLSKDFIPHAEKKSIKTSEKYSYMHKIIYFMKI